MNLEFLSNLLGEDSPAPHVYAGNRTLGFLILEDLPGTDRLHLTLYGNDPTAATQALVRYAETLERLDFKLSRAALKDVEQAANILSNPGAFSAFTHGDPVFSNIIESQGALAVD